MRYDMRLTREEFNNCIKTNIKYEKEYDATLEMVMHNFKNNFLCQDEEIVFSRIIKIPTTWFQRFKLDVFPEFLLKRFPVTYITNKLSINARTVYPTIDIDKENVIHFESFGFNQENKRIDLYTRGIYERI